MVRSYLSAALACLVLAASANADTVTKKDGTVLKGKIVQEDNDILTIQGNVDELVIRNKVAKKDITSIQRDAKAEAVYCRIPIEGEIGPAVKAEWLAKTFDQARALNATYVVLDINSGGGHVDEMIKIVDLIKGAKDTKFVARVKNAGSAAAIIATTCPTIIMTADGSIGAAVPFKFGPNGTPENIEAKFFSYFESIARSAASHGGHSPLLVRGMMESNLVLSRVLDAGTITIVEGEDPKGTVIKKSGQILTLQGREAVSNGLASGVVDSLAGAAPYVGLKSWASAGETPAAYLKARQNEQVSAKSQVVELRQKIADATAQANAIQDDVNKLGDKFKADLKKINDDYTRTVNANRPPSEIDAALKKAKETREAQITALKARYDATFEEQKRLYDSLAASININNAKLAQLQAQLDPR